MNATIDIITPSGKSLEGFPCQHDPKEIDIFVDSIVLYVYDNEKVTYKRTKLHPGDMITIKIV